MLTYKTQPKIKKYLALGILEQNKKKTKIRFFQPKFRFFFSKSSVRFKELFSLLLSNRKKLKLRYGFHKTSSLQKILAKILKQQKNSHRFLKVLEFCSILERRLDVILLRLGFVSSLFEAKHLISHKKVFVNGKFVTRSAHLLKKGDIVSLDPEILFFIRQKIKQTAKTSSLFFTQVNTLEINWNNLRFVLLREKFCTNNHYPQYMFPLNWESLSNE